MSSKGYETSRSWTDDLPVCHDSGAGFSTNQIYREDGCRQEMHSFEDRSFHCRLDDDTCLYGVFDGQEGSRVADFALQRITAEILLGQLSGKKTDEEVKEILRQAFISVERGYLDSIDSLLAQRTSLQYEIPEGLSQYEVTQNYQDILDKLSAINHELAVGTSAIVALLFHNRLFVANVGTCRALLCRTDVNSVMRVVQLSVDHDIQNEDEILRLSQLGLDMESIRQGNLYSTRCLGSYNLKGGHRESALLSAAMSEPVISDPEIHGGIEIDESCRFLLLMSAGLYHSLQEATSTEPDQVNKELVQMAVEQFRVQSTLPGVAQAVVDKAVRLHHDSYMQGSSVSGQRDDITLLVRNMHFPLRIANIRSPIGTPKNITMNTSNSKSETNRQSVKRPPRTKNKLNVTNSSVRFNPIIESHTNKSVSDLSDSSSNSSTQNSVSKNDTNINTTSNNAPSDSSTSSELYPHREMIDWNKKVKAYVDFTDYYEKVEEAKANGSLPEGINFD